MKRTHLNPPELPDWSRLFSQVVIAEGSPLRVIAISGQVGVDRHEKIAGNGGFAAQVDAACGNLAAALGAAGASTSDVVKLTIYVAGYRGEHVAAISDALGRHFGSGPRPALTLVGVQTLARPEFQVEVEALAIAGEPAPHADGDVPRRTS